VKKLVACLVGMTMFAISGFALAEGKIAVLNINAAIQNTDIAQKRIRELRETADYTELRARLDSIDDQLQKMSEDAEKNGVTWDQAKQVEFSKKRDYALADRKLIIEKLQAEDRVLSQKIMQELGEKAQTALQQLIEADGIGLVLNANPQSIIHVDASYDITAKLTDRINKAK